MKMAHLTVNTAKLDESIRFYQAALGLDIVEDFRAMGGMPIVFLRGTADAVSVELIENPDQPYHGSGVSVGFHVDDVKAAYEQAEKGGFHPSPILSPKLGVKFFFIEDPNGLKIQLT